MTARFPQDLPPEGCNDRVGFLFKRRCGRTSRVGCPHCDRGTTSSDSDQYYADYDSYSSPSEMNLSNCGEEFNHDFTEADAAAFTDDNCPSDFEYESDMGAS